MEVVVGVRVRPTVSVQEKRERRTSDGRGSQTGYRIEQCLNRHLFCEVDLLSVRPMTRADQQVGHACVYVFSRLRQLRKRSIASGLSSAY
jgi:hypothetical protein